ncbi:MAG: hypothetical protein AAB320_05255 [Elusimicrobiota bacterium]|mgnify:CR=1 FL=1
MEQQMPQVPEIKTEVNRGEEEDKKKGGFFANLLSKLSGGGAVSGAGLEAGAAAGLGSGLGGAGLAGGLLATKAGIIGLVLVGSTLASSVGFIGYKVFGPSGEDNASGNYSSLFDARPKPAPGSEEAGGAAQNGNSDSLNALVSANNKPEAPAAAEGSQTSDAPSADASASAAAPVNNTAALNNANAPSQGAAAKLQGGKKMGELSKVGAGGGGGGSSGASGGGSGSAMNLASAKGGKLSGMSGGKAAAAGGGLRGLSGVRRAGAVKQLAGIGKDARGATNTVQAGRGYENGTAQSNNITGPDSAGPDGGGVGAGAGAGRGPSSSGGSPDGERFPAPPAAEAGKNVTPWQGAINTGMMLIVGAAALLFIAAKLAKTPPVGIAAYACAAIAGLMGLALIALGSMIGGGEFGQPLQGGLLSVAGGFLTAAAAVAIWGGESGLEKCGGDPSTLMMVCGGGALVAAAGAYMMPGKSYPPDMFKDGKAPDWNQKYEKAPDSESRHMPEEALKQYLANGPYLKSAAAREVKA